MHIKSQGKNLNEWRIIRKSNMWTFMVNQSMRKVHKIHVKSAYHCGLPEPDVKKVTWFVTCIPGFIKQWILIIFSILVNWRLLFTLCEILDMVLTVRTLRMLLIDFPAMLNASFMVYCWCWVLFFAHNLWAIILYSLVIKN
jgi:hypothetical protein